MADMEKNKKKKLMTQRYVNIDHLTQTPKTARYCKRWNQFINSTVKDRKYS